MLRNILILILLILNLTDTRTQSAEIVSEGKKQRKG